LPLLALQILQMKFCKLMDLFAPYLLRAPKSCAESLYEVNTLQHATFAFRDGNSYARHVDLTKKYKILILHEERFRINFFRLIYEGLSVAEFIQVIINRWKLVIYTQSGLSQIIRWLVYWLEDGGKGFDSWQGQETLPVSRGSILVVPIQPLIQWTPASFFARDKWLVRPTSHSHIVE
jgi:hypothetical protein